LGTFADQFAKGDYPNAMNELEKVREKISPGVWHFNMGTVQAKLSRPAEARYHFLEARHMGLQEEALTQNLQFIEDQLEVVKLEKPIEPMDYAMKFGLWAENGFFTMLSLILLLGGLLVLKREKKYWVLAVTIIVAAIPIGIGTWVNSWDRSVNLVPHEVLEGPSAIFASRGELPPGVMVITKRSGDWVEIIYPSRFRGWIKSTGLKELE
jgi:hypothetical protein